MGVFFAEPPGLSRKPGHSPAKSRRDVARAVNHRRRCSGETAEWNVACAATVVLPPVVNAAASLTKDEERLPAGACQWEPAIEELCWKLLDLVRADQGELGALAHSLRSPLTNAGRQRDLFPLPLPSSRVTSGVDCSPAVISLADAVVAVLNYLRGIRAPVRISAGRRLSAAQKAVHERIFAGCHDLIGRLGASPPPADGSAGVWKTFASAQGGSPPALVADLVANIDRAGGCDPMPLLSPEIRAVVASPAILFEDAPEGLSRFPGFYAGERDEYVRLVVAQVRCGKLGLADSVAGGGTVFTVAKGDGAQREVWHGKRVSGAARRPPRPEHLASPTAFRSLELVEGRRLRVSKRDGRCFFDQLSLPPGLRRYMGRPAVKRWELLAAGLSEEQLCLALEDGVDPSARSLWPVSRVWGMGFSWSSYIAQNTLLQVCASAGLGNDKVLSTDGTAPASFAEVFALATDDVMIFSDQGPGGTVAATHRLETALSDHGIQKNGAKDVDDALTAECVGFELVDGSHWWPPSTRLWKMMLSVVHLHAVGSCTPVSLRGFLGAVQWYDLIERMKLSVYDTAYAFAGSEPQQTIVPIPSSVLRELLCSVVLAPYWGFDMRREHADLIVASDASTSFGLGVSVSHLDVSQVRAVSKLDAKVGEHVVLDHEVASARASRLGARHRLNLKVDDFHVVLSVKAPCEHINIMEARGFLAALRWVLRSVRYHGKRIVMLVDSKVWLGAAAKGRSSSWPLLRLVRKAAALTLATGVVLHLVFIPTEHNPADLPSRGKVPHRDRAQRRGAPRPTRLERLIAQRCAVITRLRETGLLSESILDDSSSSSSASSW